MTANTPLHWACEAANAPLVQQLLQYKPQLDMQNLNMCEYSTGQWVVGDDPIMPLDKVCASHCVWGARRGRGQQQQHHLSAYWQQHQWRVGGGGRPYHAT